MQQPEDGSANLLNSLDGYASLLSVILSNKRNEEIQEELMDLVGFQNIDLCGKLIEKREIIQEQCRDIETDLKSERTASSYKPKNMDVNRPGVGISVEHKQVKKKGKRFTEVNSNQN